MTLTPLFANHLPEPIVIPAAGVSLEGTLTLPPYPLGEVVHNATHLFEEPGALEQVVALARIWFAEHLGHMSTVGSRIEAVR